MSQPNKGGEPTSGFLPAVLETIRKSKDDTALAVDKFVDLAIDPEVLQHVPLFGVAVKLLKVRDAFIEGRLKRNCIAFMQATADIAPEEAAHLEAKLTADSEFAEEFLDTLLSVLMEAQKPIKCQLIGKLLGALARDRISKNDFDTLSLVVLAASIPALNHVPIFAALPRKNGIPPPELRMAEPLLASAGLIFRFGTGINLTEAGKLLLEHGFGAQEFF